MNYDLILKEACLAGEQAAEAKVPTPMVVAQRKDVLNDNSEIEKTWFVPQGVCGFAWVETYEHGNGPFVKYLKANPVNSYECDKKYGGGYYVYWVLKYGQCYEKKVAYANAFAAVCQNYGLKVYAGDRLD